MGVTNNKPNIGFLKILQGTFRQEVSAGTDGSVSRTNKENRIVHEMVYTDLEGTITKVDLREHEEYGHQLCVDVTDGKETFQLQLPLSSNHADVFLNKSANIDFKKPVCFSPYQFTPKGEEKEKRGMVIKQNGEKVESLWTKENPGDVPELEKKKVKGKDVWDNSKRIDFYVETVIPAIQAELATA